LPAPAPAPAPALALATVVGALALLGTPLSAAAQADAGVAAPPVDAPVASAALSEREVTLGRSFFLFVRVVYAPGIDVNLPANLGLPEGLEELRRTNAERENPDGSFTREFEVELMAFSLGELGIAPMAVTYSARGDVAQVQTNPLALRVVGVIGDGAEELRDIAGPVDVERDDLRTLYALIAVVATLIVGLLLWWAIRAARSRRKHVAARIAARRLPVDEEALARLADLESRGALERDDLKPTYLEMSEIVKGYIGRRYGFPANELTALEIRNELAARPSGQLAETLIRPWFEAADLVKFANAGATPEQARRALDDARDLIDQTRPGAEAEAPRPAPEEAA
jgi:hypothetical protein